MIRPVGKPTAPPPPPSPPRRISSGIRHPHGPAIEGHADLQTPAFCDPPTMAAARQRIHEIARELPREHDRMEPRFDDETQARPVNDAHDLIQASPYRAPRPSPLDVPYDSLPSLEAHQGYSEPPPSSYAEPSTQHRGAAYQDQDQDYDDSNYTNDNHDHYSEPVQPALNRTAAFPGMPNSEDSGPRQRMRKNAGAVPQYDAAAYEANYGRREGSFRQQKPTEDEYAPETEMVPGAPRREASYQAPRREASYQAPRREESYQPPQQHQSYQRARKESGERERSYQPPQPEIPQAPRVPHDMKVPAGFVMGVQPIVRTPNSGAMAMPGYTQASHGAEAFPPLVQQPMQRIGTPMMGVPYGMPQQHSPRAMHQHQPMMHQPMHHQQQHMHVRPPTTNIPVGHQLQMTEVEEAQQGSKVGRFAWFVFGAAFGIFFAFFATGFVPRLGKKEEITFPNPPALPAQQAPVAAAPPPVQAPPPPVVQPQAPPPVQFAPPVAAAPAPKAPAAPPAFAPAPPPTAASQPFGVIAASPAAAAPPPQKQAAAAPPPAPRGQRAGTIARRPAAGPKAPAADDDDRPSPPPASKPKADKGGDGIGDLLNAGLAP